MSVILADKRWFAIALLALSATILAFFNFLRDVVRQIAEPKSPRLLYATLAVFAVVYGIGVPLTAVYILFR